MELWVRSQCGELLEKTEMVKVGTTDSGKTYSIIVNNDYVYADYKTKERALEVLDEIDERIALINSMNLIFDTSSLISFKNAVGEDKIKGLSYPYQMPKE